MVPLQSGTIAALARAGDQAGSGDTKRGAGGQRWPPVSFCQGFVDCGLPTVGRGAPTGVRSAARSVIVVPPGIGGTTFPTWTCSTSDVSVLVTIPAWRSPWYSNATLIPKTTSAFFIVSVFLPVPE